MAVRIAPSARAHGAQRMLSMTTLTVEAFVVFFAALVAHQLIPEHRVATWTLALISSVLLLLTAGILRRGSVGYVVGAVLQVPVILMGIVVPAMWVIGPAFAALYVYGVVRGNRWDAEKDEIDRRVLAERAAQGEANPTD
ncbi:DUF4233 domain-containing protein [Brachybacterium sp. AOP25-B2-12]|uniref:DUF4233 domain-containing protein n=1 Tax=Brachybacterium sp. AOP25-B2-12 TaxID=3457710 RepID=UPI00403477EC